jgi:glycosyltransferase involved in cell wall biosynthesis
MSVESLPEAVPAEARVAPAPLCVLQVLPRLQSGSAEVAALSIVRDLAAAGHAAWIVASGTRLDEEVAAAGGRVLRLDVSSGNPWVMLRNALKLRVLVRRQGIDILHAWDRAGAWSTWLAARLSRTAFVTTCLKGYAEPGRLKRFYTSVMARGDRVLTMSEPIAELIHDRYGTPWDRLRVVQHGLDLARFDPGSVTPDRRFALRQAWGVGPATRVILLVGRLAPRKGAHVLVHAASRLKQRGLKDFVCVLVGADQDSGVYATDLWDLILSTDTADVVRFGGFCADMPAAYAAATVVVTAAIEAEGLQLPVIEAQAMGVPVIASDLSAGPDALLAAPRVAEDRAAGIVVRSGDEAGLAAAMIAVLARPDAARRAMGTRGRAFVVDQFAADAPSARMVDIYADLVAGRRPPVAKGPR